ncbi:aflatoxin biosynthesis ketoreductase-like protein nor-1 [Roridomyces roridus]|uniref:Aflatoxin biosynthesis ketoreductase-like protein nor-1 n=1 Tax=Roridomyces roridus TaxID=1738132 RepID=A0AAD7FYD3_9AGAR|nr:aflatoxin biosynthesis ketoreductase-like protein nor-1 [Roridomyces roridus]
MSGKIVYLGLLSHRLSDRTDLDTVTGSNRGIGHGLVSVLAARPDAIVFAGARDPMADSLKELAAKYPNLHPIHFVANDVVNNEAAVAEIKKTAGQLDVVIANAGIGNYAGPLSKTPLSVFTEHWQVNTLGTVVLFQAVQDLLLASPTGEPIFAYISSGVGSIGGFINFSTSGYGASKAASNYLIKALDAEHPSLISMAISPGWVATDMGNSSAAYHGREQAPVTVEDSVEGILQRVDGATKEKSSGRFWNFTGDERQW